MESLTEHHPLLQEEALQERRALYQLGEADLPLAEALQRRILAPRLQDLSVRFYQRLFAHPALDTFVHDQRTRARLKETFSHYLSTLGVDCLSRAYAEERLRVGLRHAHIGLPLTYYLAAYRILQDLLVECIVQQEANPEPLIRFVLKITGYDTALATEAYHFVRTHRLQDSIECLQEEKAQLCVAANTDALTRLANRRHILALLERRVQEAAAGDEPLSVAMVDIDDFKLVNDRYGHLCGDKVLVGLAELLRDGLRSRDLVGRYGGEEFMLILSGAALEQARTVVDRLRRRLAEHVVACKTTRLHLTLSAGVTQYHPGESVTHLIERADRALYQAKGSGKNRVVADP